MWFSDLFLNNLVYASETFVWFASYQLYTLVPMALIVLAGIFLFKNNVSAGKVLGGSLLATVIFFLVSNFGASATDNSGSSTLNFDLAEGSLFVVGTTQVTATAVDGSGNSSQAAFNIIVNDVEVPVSKEHKAEVDSYFERLRP